MSLRVMSKNADASYHDRNDDDEFHWLFKIAGLPASAVYRRGSMWDICRGSCRETIPYAPSGDYVFVIQSFSLRFRNGDHHIDRVAILEDHGRLSVTYADRRSDDDFSFWVDYAYIPRHLLRSVGVKRGSRQLSGRAVAIPWGTVLIRGFSFDFNSSDHHLTTIGVDTLHNLRMHYEDKNGDDRFDWDMRYATVD